MLYREIIAVCSEIHTKHINTLGGQNVEFWNFKPVVHAANTHKQTHTYTYIYIITRCFGRWFYFNFQVTDLSLDRHFVYFPVEGM